MSLTQTQADTAIAAARREAELIGIPMNIAVLDAAVHLKGFARMDGALLGSIDIAIGKAKTAALFGINTEVVGEFSKPGGTSPGLENTNGGLIVFAGGIPVRGPGDAVIGSVGVSGGSVAQDFQVAKAAVAAVGAIAESGLTTAQTKNAGDTERNRALVAKGMQAWAEGTGTPYDLLADDVRWTITGNSLAAKTYPSKEAFLSEVIRPFNGRLRDRLIPTVHRYYVEGDTVIVHFDARGTALDGEPYANSYAWILRMKDARIIEAYAFFDSTEFDDFWTRVAPAQRS